jgi:alpha-tubulin suppressor-like RCC1 family protein
MRWSLRGLQCVRRWSRVLAVALVWLVLPAQASAQGLVAGQGSAGQSLGSTLDAGEFHSCGIFERATIQGAFENGTVHCWGDSASGQTSAPQGNFTAISAGVDHSCALRGSGQVVCWGNPGSIAIPPPAGSYIALSAGNAENCAVRSDGQLRCWGGVMAEAAPTTGSFLTVSVSPGRGCAIRANGTLQCWQAPGVASLGTVPTGRYLALDMGTSHACALRSDGKVRCWGSNTQGQTSAPTAPNFVAIATGHQHSCAIQENGTVSCWGGNPSGQLSAPAGKFTAITAGRLHTCARADEGSVQCWGGSNSRGEINTSSDSYQTLAVGPDQACGLAYASKNVGCVGATSSLTPPVELYNALSFGSVSACGLTVDGRAQCWGESLGAAPNDVLMAIAVGGAHVCALRLDGSAVCWGDNSFGQATPIAGSYSSIVSGDRFSCGQGRDDGRVHCWGQGLAVSNVPQDEYFYSISAFGANICGRAVTDRNFCWGQDAALLQPPAVPLGEIVVGARHACGVRSASANSIECWGDNTQNQLQSPSGNGFYRLAAFGDTTCTADDYRMLCWGAQTLSRNSSGTRLLAGAIAAGDAHTCTVRGNRGVGCWGDNTAGQRSVPTHFAQTASANLDHSCTLRADGQLLCWGDNTHAGSTPVAGAMRAFDVGQFNGCAVAGTGALGCWGWNVNGQSTPPTGTFRSVATGLNHSCGVRDDGTLGCWGYNADGQTVAPTGTFKTVDVGERHSCAIAIDGSLRCWGLSTEGQTTLPDLPGASYRALAAGAFHNCAIISNGSIACWGRNDSGQATPPEEGLFTAITAGFAHSCAVRDDGMRMCWGANTNGQAPQVSISPTVLPQLTNEAPVQIDFTLVGTGGYVPVAPKFLMVSGGLPFNVDINAFGQMRGVPSGDPGIYTFTIEAVDENGFFATRDFELVLNRAPDITPPQIRALVNDAEYYSDWYNTDVALQWQVSDPETPVTATSGCTNVTVNTDTDGISFTCTATSEGGTSTQTIVIRRDTVAPQTAFAGPQTAAFYGPSHYPVARVLFTFAPAVDDRSGIDSYECALNESGTFARCMTPYENTLYASPTSYKLYVRTKDIAGNVDPTPAMHEFIVRVDDTRPVVTPLITGTLGDNGWYTSNVQLRWSIEDPETGIIFTEGCRNLDVTRDTTEAFDSCLARSLISGETTTYVSIKRDANAPVIFAVSATPPNAAGWHRQDVSVNYICVEVTSGLATLCPGSETLVQEGRNLSTTVKIIRDRAGNVGTSNILTVNLDKTPPVTSVMPTTQPNAAGWYRNNIVVNFACTDALSGMAAPCTPQMIVSTEGSNNPGELVYDVAGNVAFTGGTGFFLDKTAPTISASASQQPNAFGWYNFNPTIYYTCSDSVSGIVSNGCPSPQLFSQEGIDTSVAHTTTDLAGNVSAPSNVVAVRIDKTAPVLSVTMPPAQLFLNATHNFDLNATDALSGIASQSCGALNTSTPGTRTVTCTATDRAGNSVSRSSTYRVIYDVVPLSAPLNNPGQLYLVEAPRSVPFEWRVRDANGVAVTNATLVQTAVTDVACPNTGIPLPTPAAGETNTFENFGDGRYRRNWWINATNPISCIRLSVQLSDGTLHEATIRIVPKIRRTGGPGQPLLLAPTPRAAPASQSVVAPQPARRPRQPVKTLRGGKGAVKSRTR